jgi:hypothetical protein
MTRNKMLCPRLVAMPRSAEATVKVAIEIRK